jgi:predicted amidohydrolase YtcJ
VSLVSRAKADILFQNGIILTQDTRQPRVSQLALAGKHILAVGDDLKTFRTAQTRVIDLAGAVMTPGFIDAHLHLFWGGESLLTLPIHQARSRESFMKLIAEYAAGQTPGDWLIGSGWNEHLFQDNSRPHRHWLDEAAPGHPVLLHRHDGHSGVVSTTALEQAGISAATPDPPGGVIDRDRSGKPTGILKDAALGLVMQHIPPETEDDLEQQLVAAQNYLLQHGVTAVGNMIYDLRHFHFLEQQARSGKLKVRITAYAPLLKWPDLQHLLERGIHEDEWFRFSGLKGFCDGSLGSHTALMLEPYRDTPDTAGIHDTDWQDLDRIRSFIGAADRQIGQKRPVITAAPIGGLPWRRLE